MPRKKEILTNAVSYGIPDITPGAITTLDRNERHELMYLPFVPDGGSPQLVKRDRWHLLWLDDKDT
jgi:hypothetical protein